MRIQRIVTGVAVVVAAALAFPSAGVADTPVKHDVDASAAADRAAPSRHRIIADTGPRPAGLPSAAGDRGVIPPNLSADVSAALDGPFYIVNKGTGRCLDAHYNEGGGNGNRVGLWDCNGGITEKWYVYNNGNTGNYWMKIINARSGRSLDYPASSGGANGWQYILWDYYPSTGQQYWPFWRSDTSDYEISVLLGGGANVMDAFASDGGGNGNRVGNWSITYSPLQRWTFHSA
ncbi:RICIN domain-containing protein [Saccharothrix australiensis]|uniref:Ricin-type beta-trefoil lectin protein n=1 Tax=Saccharothrix australiensis TaxID=2072 RepID=A0A495W5X3_9PSEU|nr:RICIN domain-containing protein [Saccharothrix australiensis]RKT55208.1 ricin-type beta-trefoil lectin protein [Saccharothrix australiensis]